MKRIKFEHHEMGQYCNISGIAYNEMDLFSINLLNFILQEVKEGNIYRNQTTFLEVFNQFTSAQEILPILSIIPEVRIAKVHVYTACVFLLQSVGYIMLLHDHIFHHFVFYLRDPEENDFYGLFMKRVNYVRSLGLFHLKYS